MIFNYFTILNQFLASDEFIFTSMIISLAVKVYLLIKLIRYSEKINLISFFLSLTLLGSAIEDFSWIARKGEILFLPNLDYRIRIFIIRFAWGFSILQWQSLALFLESLVKDKFRVSKIQRLLIPISGVLSLSFFYFAFIESWTTYSHALRGKLELILMSKEPIYVTILIALTVLTMLMQLHQNKSLPKILKTQVKTVLAYLIMPKAILDFIQMYPFNVISTSITSTPSVISMSALLSALAAYYCMKKILQLRFLNLRQNVQSKNINGSIEIFKDVLDQMGQVTEYKELFHITKTFFKNTFNIAPGRTKLHIDQSEYTNDYEFESDKLRAEIAKRFFNEQQVLEYLRAQKILIYDEVEFSNFYEKDEIRDKCLQFMDKLNSEIFIPVFNKKNLVAYITVEAEPKRTAHYNNEQQSEIFIFASYLGNIINLLQKRNLSSILINEKEMKDEIFQKHQEINQYKESVRSFLKESKQNKIGIIFYKNRRFSFGNQHAKELIKFNINTDSGFKLTQDLKKTANLVEEYKSPQMLNSHDPDGKTLVISALPNLEYNNVIIMIYYPDISDLIKPQLELMKDPTKWDFLLYLETTDSGRLVNQLIPSNSETLLDFKIQLLQTALSKKATLLEMHHEDLIPTVELLHHISLRENLHILKLNFPSKSYDTAIKLFGINPIFGNIEAEPLMQKLNGTSTLFIQNIHFMDIETQEYLAEFLKYGVYRVFKSEQKMSSNVRVICSTSQDLKSLVFEGKFSENLFACLNKTSLSMPSVVSLPDEEVKTLIHGYTHQAIKDSAIKSFLELTEKDFIRILDAKPSSLKELKAKVRGKLEDKSKKNVVFQEAQFDPAFNVSDPQLAEAARLGKHALRDPKLLAMLWSKFKNQNKIATFLGVNRSSVHRRCREYNIQ